MHTSPRGLPRGREAPSQRHGRAPLLSQTVAGGPPACAQVYAQLVRMRPHAFSTIKNEHMHVGFAFVVSGCCSLFVSEMQTVNAGPACTL